MSNGPQDWITMVDGNDSSYTYHYRPGDTYMYVFHRDISVDRFLFDIRDCYVPDMDALGELIDDAITVYWEGA